MKILQNLPSLYTFPMISMSMSSKHDKIP